jgi:hypothetical protein
MHKADPLIRTKLRLPLIRPGLVPRPRLQEQIAQGLRGPLTLVTAPAGFGKTTLVASCVAGCGMPVAWLSLDKDDNQAGRFLQYLVAALQQADDRRLSDGSPPLLPWPSRKDMSGSFWMLGSRLGNYWLPICDHLLQVIHNTLRKHSMRLPSRVNPALPVVSRPG